ENREEPDHAPERKAGATVPRRAGALGRRLALDARIDRAGRGFQPGVVAPLAEARRDRLPDDARGLDVGNRALEAVPHLDTNLSILQEDEHDGAVVEVLASDPPALRETKRKGFTAAPR